jgi:hypothetical protein
MPLRRHFILSAAVLILGAYPLLAANVTYTVTGTLGPVLSGSDPVGANGQSATVTVTASQTLTPIKHTATSATYKLPIGALTLVLNGKTYTSTQVSYMTYTRPAGPSKLIVTTTVSEFGIPVTLTATVQLARGSFAASALTHPAKFRPSPQTLTAATVAGGPGSQFKYSASLFGTTVLGLSGTASN